MTDVGGIQNTRILLVTPNVTKGLNFFQTGSTKMVALCLLLRIVTMYAEIEGLVLGWIHNVIILSMLQYYNMGALYLNNLPIFGQDQRDVMAEEWQYS